MILPGGSIICGGYFAVADMVTCQSLISGNRKHWYHNIGCHQCYPGDVLLRQKDCRKLLSLILGVISAALRQLLSAESNGQVLRTSKVLLELPSFL